MNEDKEPAYDSLSTMPFGKHRGEYLQDVPSHYFRWWWTEGNGKDYCKNIPYGERSDVKHWILDKVKLANYIWNNKDDIQNELGEPFI